VTARISPCDEATIAGRLRKAEQFLDAAETIREFADDEHDIADAYVTLCVHAGVAAADVICCIALGEHAMGEDHQETLALIARVRPDGNDLAKSLRPLLGMKTWAGYSHRPVSAQGPQARRTQRATTSAYRPRPTHPTRLKLYPQPSSAQLTANGTLARPLERRLSVVHRMTTTR